VPNVVTPRPTSTGVATGLEAVAGLGSWGCVRRSGDPQPRTIAECRWPNQPGSGRCCRRARHLSRLCSWKPTLGVVCSRTEGSRKACAHCADDDVAEYPPTRARSQPLAPLSGLCRWGGLPLAQSEWFVGGLGNNCVVGQAHSELGTFIAPWDLGLR